MEKQEILNRINAIKNILEAATNGERIKSAVKSDMDKAGVSFPDDPEPIGGVMDGNGDYVYGTERYDSDDILRVEGARDEYYNFLNGREDWTQMDEFSRQIQLKIYKERFTLEDISNYIQTNAVRAVDMDNIHLEECKETENDLKYADSLGDDEIIALFDSEDDFSNEIPWSYDVVMVILEKGISLDDLPEKLLFNTSFIDAYIKQVSLIRAREKEQKGLIPRDVEDASNGAQFTKVQLAITTLRESLTKENVITPTDEKIDN